MVPVQILPDIWVWRYALQPNTGYWLVGADARTSDEMYMYIHGADTRTHYVEYSRVDVPADPIRLRKAIEKENGNKT